MEKRIIILLVAIVVIIIVIIILAYLVYHFTPPNPNNNTNLIPLVNEAYPFDNNDTIRMSFILVNPGESLRYRYSYYPIVPKLNNANLPPNGFCAGAFNALDVTTVWDDTCNFTVNINQQNKREFSLILTNGNRCFLAPPLGTDTVRPNNKYISHGPKDPTSPDIWFTLSVIKAGDQDYIINTPDADSMGLITLYYEAYANFCDCYTGQQIIYQTGVLTALIVGVNNVAHQPFLFTNLTKPIKPPLPPQPYNFTDGDIITFQFSKATIYLFNGCADAGTSITFSQIPLTDQRVRWTVTMSSDKRAFALSQGGRFLYTTIQHININFLSLALGASTPSNYDGGDYSSWFLLDKDNKLQSIWTTLYFGVDSSATVNCSHLAYSICAVTAAEATPYSIIKITG